MKASISMLGVSFGIFVAIIGKALPIGGAAMFITATAPNPLITAGIREIAHIDVSWSQWSRLRSLVEGFRILVTITEESFFPSSPSGFFNNFTCLNFIHFSFSMNFYRFAFFFFFIQHNSFI